MDVFTQLAASSRTSAMSADSSGAGGAPSSPTRSIWKVAGSSCSQSLKYWRITIWRARSSSGNQFPGWGSRLAMISKVPSSLISKSSAVGFA